MNEEKHLIDLYHRAQENNDDESIIAISLKLAQLYYENEDMQKARKNLLFVKNKDEKVENLNLYLGLIEIYFNNIEKAKKNLKKELKYHPNNKFAKQVLDKIKISSNFPYATLLISIILILIFSYFFYPEMNFSQNLNYGLSAQNMSITTAITSIFSHVNVVHLILNTILLLSIGSIIERHIGTLQFSLFFLITGIIANYSQIILTNNNSIVLGASGAIFGIIGILVMQQPLLKLRLFGIFKIPVIILYGLIFATSLLFSKYYFSSAEIAHLIGLFIGIAYAGILYNDKIYRFYNWVLISFGFYFVISLPEILIYQNFYIYDFLISLFLFIIGGLLIIYSYYKLKYLNDLEIEGDENE